MGSTVTRTRTVLVCALSVASSSAFTTAGAAAMLRQAGADFELSGLEVIGEVPVQPARSFTAVSADMDRDDDLDLFINWHLRGPSELYENCGGVFRLVNAPGADRSGLYENQGVPYLYATLEAQVARIEAQGGPGLYVWHDPDRHEFWRFYLEREADAVLPALIGFEANQDVLEVAGLAPSEVTRDARDSLQIRIPAGGPSRLFGVHVKGITTQATVRLVQPALAVFAGRHLTPVTDHPVKLWKPDPHGVAWVHVTGGPEPELFITRGANQGNLAPPDDPKNDRFYEWTGGETLYSMAAPATFPQTYSRGRQVAWVDVDNDGTNELYVGNRDTRNTLAVRDAATGVYRDDAPSLGLDLVQGEAFTWIDFDDDGYQDLLYLLQGHIAALRNQGGTGFAAVDPRDLGLVIESPGLGIEEIFERFTFHVADFDNDGRLDVLVSGVGTELSVELFVRHGTGFRNVTTASGLAALCDAFIVLPFDADNDSFEDFLKINSFAGLDFGSEQVELVRNDGGSTFSASTLDLGALGVPPFNSATVTDVDSDGLQDALIVSANDRHVLRNVSDLANEFLEVRFSAERHEPIGALVTAHYDDGSLRAQRYGSANNPPFSQSLPPLHFGVAAGTTLRHLSVLRPGDSEPTIRPVHCDEIGTTIDI